MTITKMNFIGIDNGLNGGICVLDKYGSIILLGKLPIDETGKKRIVDAFRLLISIRGIGGESLAVVERPAGAKSYKAGVSMQDSFATIRTTLLLANIPTEYITALTWQKTFWLKPKRKKGDPPFDTKAAALDAARDIWPDETFLATKRSKVPHDGLVDAALIAKYCLDQHELTP